MFIPKQFIIKGLERFVKRCNEKPFKMTVSDRQPRGKGLIANTCETTKLYDSLAYNFILLLQQLKPF